MDGEKLQVRYLNKLFQRKFGSDSRRKHPNPSNNTVRFVGRPHIDLTHDGVIVSVLVEVSPQSIRNFKFFTHWGQAANSSIPWRDEEIFGEEITKSTKTLFTIRKLLRPNSAGSFGVTFYARCLETGKCTWLGRFAVDDGRFELSKGLHKSEVPVQFTPSNSFLSLRASDSLESFTQFSRMVTLFSREHPFVSLSKILFDITKGNPGKQQLLREYHELALSQLANSRARARKQRFKNIANVLENLGIGEVVFVAPEGPHAQAGGLAQVIVGLGQALGQTGIPTTLITPLYEYAQGQKHRSADDIIQNGVEIADKKASLDYLGHISVPFGPTYFSGTKTVRSPARVIQAEIYKAESGRFRIFFLRYPELAPCLYPESSSDQLLRQAVFLSRGALEVVTNSAFGITPHFIITNDWLTALIPALLKTDPRYKNDEVLQNVQSAHILHNCGEAYQGRLYVNQYGEDLWPIIGLGDEHYFGLCDPHDRNRLNLTAGAILHVEKGVVAVSKPYAQELLLEKSGEGLDKLLAQKAGKVFGISNGVDLSALRAIFRNLGESARTRLNLTSLSKKKLTTQQLAKNLSRYKSALKVQLQKQLGLNESKKAVMLCFVGRLAEQKGTGLLSARLLNNSRSVLENLLRQYPEVQVVIAGPRVSGDQTVADLAKLLSELEKRYPGRIRGLLDFVPHSRALEIIGASDFQIMPSRYEPGGITQLEALAVGTLVIARNVGGISATLSDYDSLNGNGNAFLFSEFTPNAFFDTVTRAIDVFRDKNQRRNLLIRAATAEHDWSNRTPKYLALLQHVSGVLVDDSPYTYLDSRKSLLPLIQAD